MKLKRTTLLLTLLLTLSVPARSETTKNSYTEPTTGMEFILIKGGSFIMGDTYGNDEYAKPPHKIAISDFYMSIYEVTFDQFDQFCAETKRERLEDQGWGRGQRPVINISWQNAIDFAEWLSRKTGKKIRLPSEAEWEYAARGGTTTDYWWGPLPGSGNALCRSCGTPWDGTKTVPVKTLGSNQNGLYHILGNVYEWVEDEWHESYSGAPNDGTPYLNGDISQRISRGGAFSEGPSSLKVHARNWTNPGPHPEIGFRLAIDAR